MRFGAVALSGIVLLGSMLLSLTSFGAPSVDRLNPVTVRIDSAVPSTATTTRAGSSYGPGVRRSSWSSGSRYSSGGGFSGGGK